MTTIVRRRRVFRGLSSRDKWRGAALVELAIVLPVFVTVMLGIIEFGRAFMVGQLVANAAREGARMAIVDGSSNSAVQSAVTSFLQSTANVSPGDVTTTITVNGAGSDVSAAQPRDLINVQVTIPFSKVSFLPPTYLASASLKSSSSMRHE